MNRMACAVFSFDRPDYLFRTLTSLLRNKDYQEFDWYFFQDVSNLGNKVYGNPEKVKKCIKIATQNIPSKNINIAEVNQGIARQKQKAHRLFDKYDRIIFFEDDMIVSKHYLHLLMQISDKFPDNVVQAGDRTGALPKNDFKNHLGELFFSGQHWWGYLIPKTIGEKIVPALDEYVDFIGEDYRRRPHREIRKKYNVKCTSHDKILDLAMKKAEEPRIATKVPRGKYIGEWGLHASPAWYKKFRFDVEKPFEFEEDAYIKDFVLLC